MLGLAVGAAGARTLAQPQRLRRIGYLSLLSLTDPPSPERQVQPEPGRDIDGAADQRAP